MHNPKRCPGRSCCLGCPTFRTSWSAARILKAAYAKLGITVEFLDVEAKRALALSSAGDVDGEIQRVAAVAQQYPTLLQLRPAINDIEPAVFTTGLELTVPGWSSIKDYQVGIVRGVGSSEAGTSGMSNVYRATSLQELVRMLDRERFDLLVTDLFSGKVEVRRQRLDSRIRPRSRRWRGSTSITTCMSGIGRWCRLSRRCCAG